MKAVIRYPGSKWGMADWIQDSGPATKMLRRVPAELELQLV